jgi:hypothetical protein
MTLLTRTLNPVLEVRPQQPLPHLGRSPKKLNDYTKRDKSYSSVGTFLCRDGLVFWSGYFVRRDNHD